MSGQNLRNSAMNRRHLLLGAATLALPHVARAASPLKIGVLNDQNGVFADYQGLGSVLAAQMALNDLRPQRPIEIVSADHQNKPDVGMAIVRRWLDQEGVHVVMDVPNSSIALAVAQFAAERNRVFIGCGAGIADLTGTKCTANTIHWDYDTWEVSHALGRAITERGGKTWFTIAADYSFGADLDRNVTAAVQQAGGQVLGGVKAPFPTSDFSAYLLQAQASGAQVLALNNAGGDTTTSLKQAAEFGLTQSMQVCGPIYNVNVTKGLGLAAAQGVLGVTPFYWDMNASTRSFSERFQAQDAKRAMPNDMQAAMYSAVTHLIRATASVNPDDGRGMVAAMKAMPTDDPLFGQGVIREDGRKMHAVHLFQTKKPAESRGDWDYYSILSTLAAEAAFRPLAEGGCPLVKA